MSGIIGAEIASIEGSSTSVDQYYLLASSVVLYYDFIITIPQEIRYIWSSKLKLMNVLIVMLRYVTVLGYVIVLVTAFAPAIVAGTTETCQRMGLLPGIIGVICQGLTLVFLIIRLFAIYDKRRWILHVTVPFGALSIVLSSFAIGASRAHSFGVPGFHLEGFSSCFADPITRESLIFFKLSYIAIILFDTLMFVMALVKTGRMYHAEQLNKSRSSIVSILLRDGSVLFAMLAISNITSFVLFTISVVGSDTAIDPNAVGFVVSSGTNSEMTHA